MKTRKEIIAICAGAVLLSGCNVSPKVSETEKAVTSTIAEFNTEKDSQEVATEHSEEEGSENKISTEEQTDKTLSKDPEKNTLTDKQSNAINMLNYLTVLTTEIASSDNSKLFLEEAYSAILDNANPNAIDDRTLGEFNALLDTLESYRMIATKRNRLEYIYEQNQAKALRAAVPNPVGLLSVAKSASIPQMVGAIAYMAIDSVTSYQNASSEAEIQYLQEGWQLDDEQEAFLHNQRKDTFSYMVKTVNENQIPTELALTEETVDTFVEWKNSGNNVSRIRFLESNQSTYAAFGDYWLTLAKSYYEKGDFNKCLNAVAEYEALNINIFRRDYDYAEVLPIAIAAAAEIYSGNEYAEIAEHFATGILNNTIISSSKKDQWSLRYIAAQTYMSIYAETHDKACLRKAYEIALDNVNQLVAEQVRLNEIYLAAIKTEKAPKGSTKAEKKEIDDYNKMLKKEREKEFVPISQPLVLNCDLLFALAKEMKLSDSEKENISNILHNNGDALFLSEPFDNQYYFSQKELNVESIDGVEYNGDSVIIPVKYVTEDSKIIATVINGDTTEVIDDWTISKIARGTEENIDTFKATYTSDVANDMDYNENSKIVVSISSTDNVQVLEFNFKTAIKKKPGPIPNDVSFPRI